LKDTHHHNEDWSLVIKPKTGLFEINFRELWRYRDLVLLLVKRDFVSFYKQTILGPIWFLVQPLLTTLMFLLVFGRIAQLPTDGVPAIVFYLAGVTCWGYFSEALTKTSETFTANANIFGKVYFPRLIIPLSIVVSAMMRLGVQLILFFAVLGYYVFFSDSNIHLTWAVALFPVLIIMMGLLGLGLGLIFSALTTKYRDLRFLLTFGVQLLMYATPIVYPLSLANEKIRWLLVVNPFTAIIETFRFGFLGAGAFNAVYFTYSVVATLIILFTGVLIFNKVEKNFMDTV
jgi:lipopolysaccharide transport system permease protein